MDFTDEELVTEILAGSIVAFERLMSRYRERVFRIAYGFTRDRELALEVSQDTWLRVHAALATWKGHGNISGWIARIAANQALNRTRFERRRPSQSLPLDLFLEPTQMDELVDGETKGMLRRSIALLAPKQQLAVVLRYFAGMSSREMAEALECSEGTARNLLFRSLEKLRSVMTESEETLS